MITLIHGPAELLASEALADLVARTAADDPLADLNTARLDGQRIAIGELLNACDTLPFLAERRLVIVQGLLRRLSTPGKRGGKAGTTSGSSQPGGEESEEEAGQSETAAVDDSKADARRLLDYLNDVPSTTELVLVEDDTVGGGQFLRRLLEGQRDGKARIIACLKPKRNELPDWIRERARLRKVRLEPQALADLVDFIGDELRQIDQELLKLAAYAGGGRAITREDVRRLVPATRAANIFELCDALGMGDAPAASRLMQHALDADGEQPLRIVAMIARQYRQIIGVKALQAQGAKPAEIAKETGVQEWNMPKLVSQANRHTFARLERAMERILAADERIKTGRLTDREAMDVLLAELLTNA